LPEQGKLRVPSPDVNQPIPLPRLGQPLPDRAALDDPTLEASTAAALAKPLPVRTSKAPFLKLTIPDPYEGRRSATTTPQESSEFPLGSPATPPR
jgi:hypothetical protein